MPQCAHPGFGGPDPTSAASSRLADSQAKMAISNDCPVVKLTVSTQPEACHPLLLAPCDHSVSTRRATPFLGRLLNY